MLICFVCGVHTDNGKPCEACASKIVDIQEERRDMYCEAMWWKLRKGLMLSPCCGAVFVCTKGLCVNVSAKNVYA